MSLSSTSPDTDVGEMYPIVDLHCDLLSYLETTEGATPDNTDDIGCALPYLKEGNVRVQVLAAYVPTEPGSAEMAKNEFRRFAELPDAHPETIYHVRTADEAKSSLEKDGTGVVAAIENASGLADESESIDVLQSRLQDLVEQAGKVLYITMTHHGANRFGGGNMTDIGLADDGRVLLDFLDGLGIAIDFSHTSDALARDILNHLDRTGHGVPILASHSNFRSVFDHARNLPDWLAKEIVDRGGVIGINFIRAFVHTDDPDFLRRHFFHGFELGLGDALCFGADFFYWKAAVDVGRIPFYHPEHEHAGKYKEVLASLSPDIGKGEKKALAFGNAVEFFRRAWQH